MKVELLLLFQEQKEVLYTDFLLVPTLLFKKVRALKLVKPFLKLKEKQQRQKILQGVFQELQNFLKQESLVMLPKSLMSQEQSSLVLNLEETEESLLDLM